LRPIRCSYEKSGRLHADNPNHPGVTEDDVRAVLTNLAYVEVDAGKVWKKYATGVCSGRYRFLTVVYVDKKSELVAITAYPASARSRRLYRRWIAGKEESKLWIPARPTE